MSRGSWGLRRKSNKTISRSQKSDFTFDDLDNESRYTAQQPKPRAIVTRPPVRLSRVEDRRMWAPGRLREAESPRQRVPARVASGRIARISHQPKATPRVVRGTGGKPLQSGRRVTRWLETSAPRFAEARITMICLKRKVRRSVLFAFKQTGKGAYSRKRRNQYSNVHCS